MRSLYWLVFISTLNHFVFTGARLAVVLDAVHLQAAPVVVGLLSGLFGLISTFTSVAAGRLTDRFGPRRFMVAASAIMALAAACAFVWPGLVSLFIVSTLVGAFYNYFFIGHSQWIGALGRAEDRLRNFSFAAVGFSIATLLGPLATGFVMDGFGHGMAFLMLALVPLFPMAILASRAIETPRAVARAGSQKHRKRGSVMELLRDPALRRIFAVATLAHATSSIVNFLVPVYGAQIGLGAAAIGMILGSYAVGTIVIRIFMPMLGRRYSNWQLMLISLGVTAVSFFLFSLAAGFFLLMLLSLFIGIGIGMSGPLSQALLYDASPPERVGEVTGLRLSAMNVNQTVVPLASGALGTAIGVAPVFWAVSAALLGGACAVRAQWRPGKGRTVVERRE